MGTLTTFENLIWQRKSPACNRVKAPGKAKALGYVKLDKIRLGLFYKAVLLNYCQDIFFND